MTLLPVPTETTVNVGDVLAAATWNSNIRDGINFLLNPPLLIGYENNSPTVPTGAWTTIAVDTINTDTYSGWSGVNGYYVAQVPGFYRATCRVAFAINGTGIRGVGFAWNNSAVSGFAETLSPALSGNVTQLQTVSLNYLPSGGYVKFMCYQNSGGNLALFGGFCEFTLQWLHA